jgi:hypothetical protein
MPEIQSSFVRNTRWGRPQPATPPAHPLPGPPGGAAPFFPRPCATGSPGRNARRGASPRPAPRQRVPPAPNAECQTQGPPIPFAFNYPQPTTRRPGPAPRPNRTSAPAHRPCRSEPPSSRPGSPPPHGVSRSESWTLTRCQRASRPPRSRTPADPAAARSPAGAGTAACASPSRTQNSRKHLACLVYTGPNPEPEKEPPPPEASQLCSRRG